MAANQKIMVECTPGSEVGAGLDVTDSLLENGQERSGARLLDTTTVLAAQGSKQPPQHRSRAAHRSELPKCASSSRIDYPATFIRSSSDGNIRASISPLPSTIDLHQGTFRGVDDFTYGQVAKQDQKREVIPLGNERRKAAEDSDIFLDASMQLMHLNGEARQRVRQLWVLVQRLGRENQISESGMDLLYVELADVLKGMGAEKLEAAKHLKSGRLVLLASSPASDSGSIASGAAVKALFGSRSTAQLMQCSLLEDQSKFEMTPVRQETIPSNGSSGGTARTPPASTLGRFALPSTASLMGMISDAFQEEPTTRVIRLQGCQVRRLVLKSPNNETSSTGKTDEGDQARKEKILHRFQLFVPYKIQMGVTTDGVRADILFSRAPVPYQSFIFEVPTPTSGAGGVEADIEDEAQVDDWVWALDRVCRFQLHQLEQALRQAPTIERYRETLQRHFPVCVSLNWLRNRVDQSTLQRRASANLSMIQIVKDLGRDKVLLDDQLFSATNPYENDDLESDSVSEVVKYMVKKVLNFEHETTAQHRVPGKTTPSHQPSSPAHRFAKNCEARALAFVERVLQGSSRTQSGGDIYDAISFFCQQEHVSICPVSQDARPVQMRILTDVTKSIFQVEVQVCMQFKVIELTPRSPTPASSNEGESSSSVLDSTALDSPHDSLREWAVLEGTLSRQFTLGQLSAPGTVTINYMP